MHATSASAPDGGDATVTPPPSPTRDRLLWAAVAVWVISTLPLLFPILPEDWRFTYGDQFSDVLPMLTALALIVRHARRSAARKRIFWGLLAGGIAAWLGVRVLYLVVPFEAWGWELDLSSDLLYLTGYLAIAFAIEARPDRIPVSAPESRLRNLETAGILFFVFGMLAYFVLVPSVFDPESYASWVPSLLLYAVLDAFLMTRVWRALRSGMQGVWARIYRMLALLTALWFLGDVVEGLQYMEVLPWTDPGRPTDLLWQLPSLVFLILALVPRWGDGVQPEDPTGNGSASPRNSFALGAGGGSRLPGLIVALAVAVPALHLLLSAAGFISPPTRRPRDLLVLISITGFGILLVRYMALQLRLSQAMERERDAAKKRLEMAWRMESVGRLAAGVAHDFANILSVIRGRADMIVMSTEAGAEIHHDAMEIVGAAQRGQSLVSQLLTVGRREPAPPAPLNAGAVLREVGPLLERILPGNVHLSIDHGHARTWVRADRARLDQVILNLVTNARDALPGGGEIFVAVDVTEVTEEFAVRHGGSQGGTYATLTVRDTGTGIPAELRTRVVEPFFTTRQGAGSGMGLSIVYGVATQAGGFLTIGDAPEGGAEVTVYLPVVPPPARPLSAPPTPSVVGHVPARTILVVEDDAPLRQTVVRVLTGLGHRVLEAESGGDAMGILQRRDQRVDLLVTDLVLPDMRGDLLGRRAQELVPGLAVLVTSGWSGAAQEGEGGSPPIHLPKPFTTENLEEAVRRALNAHPPPSPGMAEETGS
ncbi:MAG: ATP-binding protein [Gemmatimonadota bacterium]